MNAYLLWDRKAPFLFEFSMVIADNKTYQGVSIMPINTAKIQKAYPDFTAEVDALDAAALKNRIVQLQEALGESEDHKEANEELKAASASVQELLGPYRDVRKAVKAKTQYIIELLKTKGQ